MTVSCSYDTMSYNFAPYDGKTACGSDSCSTALVTWSNSAGEAETMPTSVFKWTGGDLLV